VAGPPDPSPYLIEGYRLRFVLLRPWTLVAGSASWLEQHLSGLLDLAMGLATLLDSSIPHTERPMDFTTVSP
jgi:hypothetical protein